MKVETIDEQATAAEGLSALLRSLPPSKVARLLALWQVGRGDYVQIKRDLFRGENLDSLYDSVLELQKRVAQH